MNLTLFTEKTFIVNISTFTDWPRVSRDADATVLAHIVFFTQISTIAKILKSKEIYSFLSI